MRRLCLALATIVVAASACARQSASSGNTRLIIGQLAEPPSLNPILLQGTFSAISALVFSRLVTSDAQGNLQPDLALRVPSIANGDITAGGKTIRYRLRSGVRWQDGAMVTAADVVFSYNAVMNPRTPVPSRQGYDDIASVTAPDPHTVIVRLKKPYSPLLSQFFGPDSNYAILPAHLLSRYASLAHVPFNSAPIGSGPYRVVKWSHGDYIEYAANPRYLPAPPSIHEIVTKFIPSAETILTQLKTGEIDAALGGDTELYQRYRALSGYRVLLNPNHGVGVILMNTAAAPLSDARVRTAIASALNRERITQLATDGVDSARDAPHPLFSYADDSSAPWPAYDPARANRLLNEAGWRRSNGGVRMKDGKQLSLQLGFLGGEPSLEAAALLVSQALSAVGVHLELKSLFASTVFPLLSEGKYELALVPLYAPTDPDTQWFWACAGVPPGGFNVTRYCNRTGDRLAAEGAATFEVSRRIALYRQVEREIAAASPIVVLWQTREIDVVPTSLQGYPQGEALLGFSDVADWHF